MPGTVRNGLRLTPIQNRFPFPGTWGGRRSHTFQNHAGVLSGIATSLADILEGDPHETSPGGNKTPAMLHVTLQTQNSSAGVFYPCPCRTVLSRHSSTMTWEG